MPKAFSYPRMTQHGTSAGRQKTEGAGAPRPSACCTEALRHNPLIHAYRKLTPHLRSAWETEHILGRGEIQMARKYFDNVKIARFFHLATLAAVPFRNSPVFQPLLRSLESIDSVLLRIPVLKWQAWMAMFVLSQPRKSLIS